MSSRRLALLDWDNTLRPGFTITDWTAFLASRQQFDNASVTQILDAIDSYSTGQLSYSEFSELAANLYAAGLAGQGVDEIQRSAVAFAESDLQNLFEFTQPFLSLLTDEGIEVCIVSGCPSEVLVAYSDLLNWQRAYGLEARHQNGYYTGQVAANRAGAAGKQITVTGIVGDEQALLAAGDSTSDLPLLENAQVKLVFDNPSLLQADPDAYHIDPFRPASEVMEALRNLLWVEICQ